MFLSAMLAVYPLVPLARQHPPTYDHPFFSVSYFHPHQRMYLYSLHHRHNSRILYFWHDVYHNIICNDTIYQPLLAILYIYPLVILLLCTYLFRLLAGYNLPYPIHPFIAVRLCLYKYLRNEKPPWMQEDCDLVYGRQ